MTISESILKLLRTRHGLPQDDISQDLMITAAWEGATEWAEAFLDRFLTPGAHTETFTHPQYASTVQLKGYPVVEITEVLCVEAPEQSVTARHVDRNIGLVMFDGPCTMHELEITYESATPMKGPLFLALLNLYDVMHDNLTGGQLGGQVKGTAIDGMRVDYDTGSSSAATSPFVTNGIPEEVLGLLTPFRRMGC